MSHVDQSTLTAFVQGDLGEHLAVHVAEHLDACAQCAARADRLDPLTELFATAIEPELPEDLVTSILAADASRATPALSEVGLGLGMIALSAAIALAPGDLMTLTRPLHSFVSGLGVGAHHLVSDAGALSLMTALALGLGLVLLSKTRKARGAW